jgi:Zn-finger nucleic acid-binding protein
MLCPRCETVLLDEVERHGVVLDLCKKCRGLWLDRGELEKILAAERAPEPRDERRDDRRLRDDDSDDGYRRKPKRGGLADLLGDLFD